MSLHEFSLAPAAPSERFAVYAIAQTWNGRRKVTSHTFRVGEPGTYDAIFKRYDRLDRAHYTNGRKLGVFIAGRKRPLLVSFLEVRQVDEAGRGLGRRDHATAIPVLTKAVRVLPDGPHTIDTYRNRRWTATPVWGCTLSTDTGTVIAHGTSPIAAAAAARKSARKSALI